MVRKSIYLNGVSTIGSKPAGYSTENNQLAEKYNTNLLVLFDRTIV